MVKSNQVRVIDKGWNRLRSLSNRYKLGKSASVGIQGDEAKEKTSAHPKITNVMLGVVHEFGTLDGRIPERSFIRSTFDEKQKNYQKEIDRIAKTLTTGKEIEGQLFLLGEKYREDIINKVRSSIPPPLAEITIERKKGETTPLWTTGQLINSIRAIVVDGKGES